MGDPHRVIPRIPKGFYTGSMTQLACHKLHGVQGSRRDNAHPLSQMHNGAQTVLVSLAPSICKLAWEQIILCNRLAFVCDLDR
jgi:hypothetical protein